MFKKNRDYASIDDNVSTMNAHLMSADFGTGCNMEESSSVPTVVATSEKHTISHAPHNDMPPSYTNMYPYLPAATNADSGTTLITCHACTSLNRVPVTASMIRCGVCSTINYMNNNATTTPTASQPIYSTSTIMACPTCTSHHNLPPNTLYGSTLQCCICEAVSSEFRIVPTTTANTTTSNNPVARVVSAPIGTGATASSMAPSTDHDNNKIITCTACTTRNRIPKGTPAGARLKCGVCSTINDIPEESLPIHYARKSPSISAKNLNVMCGHCHTLNRIHGSHDGVVIPQRIICGNCHKVNAIPKISGNNSITVNY
jgi:hypothetical protein